VLQPEIILAAPVVAVNLCTTAIVNLCNIRLRHRHCNALFLTINLALPQPLPGTTCASRASRGHIIASIAVRPQNGHHLWRPRRTVVYHGDPILALPKLASGERGHRETTVRRLYHTDKPQARRLQRLCGLDACKVGVRTDNAPRSGPGAN